MLWIWVLPNKRMNRNDLAFASFGTNNKFNPTFGPVSWAFGGTVPRVNQMDPTSLVSFFRLLQSFAQGAKDHRIEDEELIAMMPSEYHVAIRRSGRRIIRLAYLGVLLSLVVVPITAPFAVHVVDGITVYDAFFRGVLLLCGAPMTFFLGVYWGLSLGMLTSPKWYLGTELGVRWRRMCSVQSTGGCRAMSLTVLTIGTGCYVLLFWLTRMMAPFS